MQAFSGRRRRSLATVCFARCTSGRGLPQSSDHAGNLGKRKALTLDAESSLEQIGVARGAADQELEIARLDDALFEGVDQRERAEGQRKGDRLGLSRDERHALESHELLRGPSHAGHEVVNVDLYDLD